MPPEGPVKRKPWQRSGPDKRIRGRTGQELRKRRLARSNGLCERCLKAGRTTLATVVNHVIPLAHGGEDIDENTENLCGPCDDEVTAIQFGKAKPVRYRGVGRDGRPTSADHPWNRMPTPLGKV